MINKQTNTAPMICIPIYEDKDDGMYKVLNVNIMTSDIKGRHLEKKYEDMLLTDGMGESQRVVYRNGDNDAPKYHYYIHYCTENGKKFIKIYNDNHDLVDTGSHEIVDVKYKYIGFSKPITLIDANGFANFLNGEGNMTFDDDHWIEYLPAWDDRDYPTACVKVGTKENGRTVYNVVNTLDMTTVFIKWGVKFVSYEAKFQYNMEQFYPKMKSDTGMYVPSAGCLFSKRADGKIDVATFDNRLPILVTEGLDDAMFDENNGYLYAVSRGKMFLLGWSGNSIECVKMLNIGFDSFVMNNSRKWSLIRKTVVSAKIGYFMEMRDDTGPYDYIEMDRGIKFPVTIRDDKYDYLDINDYFDFYETSDDGKITTLSDRLGCDPFEYAEPAEENEDGFIFRVKQDGEWKAYFFNLKNGGRITEMDPEQ